MQPLLYTDLAEWFHLLTRPEDYAEEAGMYARAIRDTVPGAREVLELGSGGGNNAWHLKRHFQMTLSDLSPQMIRVSRRLNPDLEHIEGDMRNLRIGRTFDAVFVHDAVMYLTGEDDLLAMLATANAHLAPGGLVLIQPDCTKETFRESAVSGGHDGGDVTPPQPGRALRYLSWTYDPDPGDTTFISDFAYLLREGTHSVRGLTDRHINGLFPRATWVALMEHAGFDVTVRPFDHSEVEGVMDTFVGHKRR